jgi:hypothetical protein
MHSKKSEQLLNPYNSLTRPATRMLTGKVAREHQPCSRLLQQTSTTHPNDPRKATPGAD